MREFHHAGRARACLPPHRLVLVGPLHPLSAVSTRHSSPGARCCAHSAPADLLPLDALALAAPTRQIRYTTRTALGPLPFPSPTSHARSPQPGTRSSRVHTRVVEKLPGTQRDRNEHARSASRRSCTPQDLGAYSDRLLEPWVWTTTQGVGMGFTGKRPLPYRVLTVPRPHPVIHGSRLATTSYRARSRTARADLASHHPRLPR
ncbi:hypothetical protein AcV7_010458 [Taiwanofungus camphoratus]|nr:hypothetical protein AcV7_010458 [Antrodia cinnamomea]